MPPNNWDSMTYHLSRAAYWRQWHTLAHFPSNYWAQNANPGNAEVLLLVTLLITHSAKLAFLVQFTAYVAATGAVYGLARQLGARPVYGIVAAGVFATMPEVILQSITPQNDLVAAAFTVCAVYFLVDAVQERRYSSILLLGAALGLAIGTKPTALFALPGLGVGLLAVLWSRHDILRITRKGMVVASTALLLTAFLGAPWYIANKVDYGNFTGPPAVTQVESVTHPSPVTLRVNLERYLIGLIDPEGPAMLSPTSGAAVCGHTADLRAQLVALARLPAVEPPIEWAGERYSAMPTCFFNEDVSWFGVAGWLVTVVALVWLAIGIASRKVGLRLLLAAGTASSLICLALLLRWSPWQQRLLITTVALGSPLLAILAQRLWSRPLGRMALYVAVLYAALGGFVTVTHNAAKPLALWNSSRDTIQVLMRPEMGPVLEHVARAIPKNARVGIFLDADDWDFPIFGPHLDRTIEPLVAPKSGYQQLPATFQYMLTHQPQSAVVSLLDTLRSTHCHRMWTSATSDKVTPWNLYDCRPRTNV